MSLPEEFLLLAYDEDGTPLTDGTRLDNGLGGAILLELALARRLDIADKRVVVLDRGPIGDALCDEALMRIADEKPRKPGHWVTKLSKQARPRILEKLVAEGVLTVEEDRVLWVFPRKKYLGMDFRTGPGVNITANVEQLPLADNSVGTIIAISTFEHVRHFWKGFAFMVRDVLSVTGDTLRPCRCRRDGSPRWRRPSFPAPASWDGSSRCRSGPRAS